MDPAIVSVHSKMVTALKSSDTESLYNLSSVELHNKLDSFHIRWKQTIKRVRYEYPAAEKEKALTQLAVEVADKVNNGKELFVHLLELPTDTPDGAVNQGLEIAEHVVNEDRAVVTTKAGEVFEYVLENGQWRCSLLHNQWESYSSLKRLEGNIKTANENLDSWRVASRETTDQRKPEGAFNTIIQAVGKGYRMTVYTVLSKDTVALLKKGSDDATQLRSLLKRHYPKDGHRREFLVKRQIDWTERVTDGRSLFAILWDTGRLKMDLKLERESKVKSVIPSEKNANLVVIVAGIDGPGDQYEMMRQSDGLWKLQSLETAIRAKAVGPIASAITELKKLSEPVEPAP